ncbi:hypothetical protein [Burkholderia glumae]|uniref:Uncharacterized protein n=1 Tax=Burkholderia glumae TaxID=337 RepID=A0AAQ0BQS1_BURGL|nr:hypothetical protein [Burkholderia glumae]AJY64730.1 hypothetical protein KS03_4062 [Burkholderia glumae LMG 2196 = ATCC 33617]KHJ59580.1 hypothetical protein NCPPB3923_28605 [Burkholderia glumae]MCM2484621.1 hypothetical protein [Burkholderia glumae]MCM2495001.1 hypothetical protein [Burkholderia glumae]MCM2510314.1 hypothetical protein [Burkholderia glumae]
MSAAGTDYRAEPRGDEVSPPVRASMRLPASTRRHGRLGGGDAAQRARRLLAEVERRKYRSGGRAR